MLKWLEQISWLASILSYVAPFGALVNLILKPTYISISICVVIFILVFAFLKQSKRLGSFNRSLEVFKNYADMKVKLFELIEDDINNNKPVEIKNIGLDLEYPLADIGDYFLNNQKISTDKLSNIILDYKGLLLNPLSPDVSELVDGGSNVNSENVLAAYRKIQTYKSRNYFQSPSITFDISHYNYPLIIHGFLLGRSHLFLGFSELDKDKIKGSDKSYIYLKYDDNLPATTHYFKFFENWFDYLYKKGKSSPINTNDLIQRISTLNKQDKNAQ